MLSDLLTSLRGVRREFSGDTRDAISALIRDLVDVRQAAVVIGKLLSLKDLTCALTWVRINFTKFRTRPHFSG